MSSLSMMEAKLPPGFRFHPRDEELVCNYLVQKVTGTCTRSSYEYPLMVEVDLNKIEPWDLPEMARVGGKDWYFFSLRDRKYATGLRTNRATVAGYWKATGKDRPVMDGQKGMLVGMRKTLVFYQGRAPKGRKTDWVMHEFRLEGPSYSPPKLSFKEDWVLCRVFYKNRGISPKPCQESPCDDTSSSGLPPLLDPFLGFDQTQPNFEGFEQVPCFSNFSPNNTPPSKTPIMSYLPQLDPTVPIKSLAHLGAPPDLSAIFNPLPCEKKVIQAVLDHLSKLDSNQKQLMLSPTYGEGCSESYLSELGLPHMWNSC